MNFAVPGTELNATDKDVLPFRANLLYGRATNHRYSHVVISRLAERVLFAKGSIETYEDNLKHPHYDRHRTKHGTERDRYRQPWTND